MIKEETIKCPHCYSELLHRTFVGAQRGAYTANTLDEFRKIERYTITNHFIDKINKFQDVVLEESVLHPELYTIRYYHNLTYMGSGYKDFQNNTDYTISELLEIARNPNKMGLRLIEFIGVDML